jgi:hypothetical protein
MLVNGHILPAASKPRRPVVGDAPCNWVEEGCGCEPDELHSTACVREQMRIQHARHAGVCAWCDEPLFRSDFCSGWCREQARRDYLASLDA